MRGLLLAAAILLAAPIALSAPPPNAAFITMSGMGITFQAIDTVVETAKEGGGHIYHIMPVHTGLERTLSGACLIGTILPGHESEITALGYGLTRLAVDPASLEPMGQEAVFAAGAWNFLLAGGGEEPPPPGLEPPPNDALGPLVNGELPGGDLKSGVKSKSLKAKGGIGITALNNPGQYQTSEFMIGRVAVGVILPESNGSGENWANVDNNAQPATNPPTVITNRPQEVFNRIVSATNWWDTTGGNAANLTFVYDQRSGIAITREPITISTASAGELAWISEALGTMGYIGTTPLDQVYSYVNGIRTSNNADWGFAVFVADSFNDTDGMFPNNTSAFAYLYGPYMVMTYDNGTTGGQWGILRMHLVASHEIAHVFGAPDEYNGAGTNTCTNYGYLSVLNGNSFACVGGAQGTCLMVNATQQLCAFTPGHVGWRDSDTDGRLDPVDCAVGFPLASLNYYVSPWWGNSQIQGSGTAQAAPWPSTSRTPVTINRITAATYSVDSGGSTALTPTDGAFNSDYEPFTFTSSSYADGPHNVTYSAQDNYGNTGALATPLQVSIDTSPPPSAPPSALIVEAPYSNNPFACTVNWTSAAGDPQSGLFGHRVILRRQGIIAPVAWADVSLPTLRRQFTGLSLQHGLQYYATVQAINRAGLLGPGVVSAPMTVDLTPPVPPTTFSDSGAGTTLLDRLSFTWNAASEDISGITGYNLSIRDEFNNWIVSSLPVGNVTSYTATGLSLALGRKYFGRVDAVNGAGSIAASPESDGILPVTAYSNISNIKRSATIGASVGVTGVYVISNSTETPNALYVEQGDRACGIRTDCLDGISRDTRVEVAGLVQLDPARNELVLANSEVATLSGTQTITPLAMVNRAVGGAADGLQLAVTGGSGVNTIGLFVEIAGTATYVSSSAPYEFVMDDGSNVIEPSGLQGIRCRCASITPPAQNQAVTVRGVCTYEWGYPILVLRQRADWN